MTAIPELTTTEVARFYSKLRLDGCGVRWGGQVNNNGYGRFEIYRHGKCIRILAHRLAYKLATGDDPGDSVVRHQCDTPPCCTPDCFLLGTQADNLRDAVKRGRVNTSGLQAFRDARDEQVERRIREGRKRCSRCQAVKEFSEFRRISARPDGRDGSCKACRSTGRPHQKKEAAA